MRLRYPALHNAQLDQEDDDHNPEPGTWIQEANMQEIQEDQTGTASLGRDKGNYLNSILPAR
ncbi:hypothetical protein DPMN_172617 [Dreissena polymorpha]|uniref:Uncharacterized protein n=1 Tax=Dreissena polymorpha TaxID=45954 RepID=A0A9D4IGS5_DREPO|nr:hypothetical protein DPMN_172617 [Dreissena polymorpha]